MMETHRITGITQDELSTGSAPVSQVFTVFCGRFDFGKLFSS